MQTTRRGETLPINQALNKSRAKLGIELSTWLIIVFFSVAVFLAGFRLLAILSQSVDTQTNTITVKRDDGELVSYDTKRLKGVNVYREVQREIAEGERVQFTTSHKELGVSNRDLGTVTKIEPNRITVRMDGKDAHTITFDPREMRHFDHGYAVTSHSSQGLTTGRVIANMDGETARSLVNSRLAYVAISRASEDARI